MRRGPGRPRKSIVAGDSNNNNTDVNTTQETPDEAGEYQSHAHLISVIDRRLRFPHER